jgi:hypothetical protein
MDMVSFPSTIAERMSSFHFPCQHSRGSASAAVCDAFLLDLHAKVQTGPQQQHMHVAGLQHVLLAHESEG